MSHLILINGYAGAGKDTFVKFVTQELKKYGREVSNLSSIMPIWQLLRNELGIDMDRKGPEERKLAAEVKAALDNYDFKATKMVLEKAKNELAQGADIVFVHMREPRALEFSRSYWNIDRYPHYAKVRSLFISRPHQALSIGNVADDSVHDYNYDGYIFNNGSLLDLGILAEEYSKTLL